MRLKITFFLTLFLFSCAQNNIDRITLPTNFYPLGITSDEKGNLYVGSLKTGIIFKVKQGQGEPETFIDNKKRVNLVSATGMISQGDYLWACSSDPGVSFFKGQQPPALKRINLKNKKITSYDLPGGGFCSDIAIDNSGNLYITDSFNPRILILRIGSDTIQDFVTSPIFEGKGFNLKGIAFDDLNNLFVTKYNDGKLFQIDIFTRKIKTIDLPRKLYAPSGIKYHKGNLIVVESASYPNRTMARGGSGKITKINLPYSDDLVSFKVIKEGFDIPTTFTIIGDDIWVVESKYDHLYKYGDKMLQPDNFFLYKLKLPKPIELRKEWHKND